MALREEGIRVGRKEERERILYLLRSYLENKWNPPNVFNLWRAGERELVEKIIAKIEENG